MLLRHHDLEIELNGSWWTEAGMEGFIPKGSSYPVDIAAANGQPIRSVAITDVAPVGRNPGVGFFNKNEQKTARERVLCILAGFRAGDAIPPIEIVDMSAGAPHRFKCTAGVHRLYCSLAAGFTHVPTIEGFDITARYV